MIAVELNFLTLVYFPPFFVDDVEVVYEHVTDATKRRIHENNSFLPTQSRLVQSCTDIREEMMIEHVVLTVLLITKKLSLQSKRFILITKMNSLKLMTVLFIKHASVVLFRSFLELLCKTEQIMKFYGTYKSIVQIQKNGVHGIVMFKFSCPFTNQLYSFVNSAENLVHNNSQ